MNIKAFTVAGTALAFCTAVATAQTAGAQSSGQSPAQGFPDRTVSIISDAAPGSAPDVAARIVADGLGALWGHQVILVNHPGANGSVAARAASEAAPDGTTLFSPSLSTFVAMPNVAPNIPVKLPQDFLPVGIIALQPMFIGVSPTLGVSTLPELIERAKKKTGQISIAATGIGRITNLTGALLEQEARIDLLAVPYTRGPASAVGDVASGRVSMIIEGFSGIIGAVKAGQVKLIAVASPKRLAEFPDLPTVAETIPNFSAAGCTLLVAPVGTPKAIVEKVSADLAKVVSNDEIKSKLAATGSYPLVMTPDQVQTFVAQQQQTWLPILQRVFR